MSGNTQHINPETTVNEVVRQRPYATGVLNSFGIDSCCGGALSLAEATRRHGVDLGVVLAALAAMGQKSPV